MARKIARGLLLIGALKLLKALALLALGTSLLSLLHRDVAEAARHWLSAFGLDAHARLAEALVAKVAGLDQQTLRRLGLGSLVYATVFTVEGLGLLLGKSWAEYLTTVVTISFLPIEAYEWLARPSALKALVTLLNVVVVIYLLFEIRRRRANQRLRAERHPAPSSG
jgi:uncharacterized membrane protein (DUF2068 family)